MQVCKSLSTNIQDNVSRAVSRNVANVLLDYLNMMREREITDNLNTHKYYIPADFKSSLYPFFTPTKIRAANPFAMDTKQFSYLKTLDLLVFPTCYMNEYSRERHDLSSQYGTMPAAKQIEIFQQRTRKLKELAKTDPTSKEGHGLCEDRRILIVRSLFIQYLLDFEKEPTHLSKELILNFNQELSTGKLASDYHVLEICGIFSKMYMLRNCIPYMTQLLPKPRYLGTLAGFIFDFVYSDMSCDILTSLIRNNFKRSEQCKLHLSQPSLPDIDKDLFMSTGNWLTDDPEFIDQAMLQPMHVFMKHFDIMYMAKKAKESYNLNRVTQKVAKERFYFMVSTEYMKIIQFCGKGFPFTKYFEENYLVYAKRNPIKTDRITPNWAGVGKVLYFLTQLVCNSFLFTLSEFTLGYNDLFLKNPNASSKTDYKCKFITTEEQGNYMVHNFLRFKLVELEPDDDAFMSIFTDDVKNEGLSLFQIFELFFLGRVTHDNGYSNMKQTFKNNTYTFSDEIINIDKRYEHIDPSKPIIPIQFACVDTDSKFAQSKTVTKIMETFFPYSEDNEPKIETLDKAMKELAEKINSQATNIMMKGTGNTQESKIKFDRKGIPKDSDHNQRFQNRCFEMSKVFLRFHHHFNFLGCLANTVLHTSNNDLLPETQEKRLKALATSTMFPSLVNSAFLRNKQIMKELLFELFKKNPNGSSAAVPGTNYDDMKTKGIEAFFATFNQLTPEKISANFQNHWNRLALTDSAQHYSSLHVQNNQQMQSQIQNLQHQLAYSQQQNQQYQHQMQGQYQHQGQNPQYQQTNPMQNQGQMMQMNPMQYQAQMHQQQQPMQQQSFQQPFAMAPPNQPSFHGTDVNIPHLDTDFLDAPTSPVKNIADPDSKPKAQPKRKRKIAQTGAVDMTTSKRMTQQAQPVMPLPQVNLNQINDFISQLQAMASVHQQPMQQVQQPIQSSQENDDDEVDEDEIEEMEVESEE